MTDKKLPQRAPLNPNRSGARYKGGRPKKHEVIKLDVRDADLFRAATGIDDLADALRRIAASYAADAFGTHAALAPLVEIDAWDGKEIL